MSIYLTEHVWLLVLFEILFVVGLCYAWVGMDNLAREHPWHVKIKRWLARRHIV